MQYLFFSVQLETKVDPEMLSTSNLDISQSAEVCPIPFDDNFSSAVPLQESFKYVKTNIPGPGFNVEKFSEQFAGCDCSGACALSTCSCLQLFGSAYDEAGQLKVNNLDALVSRPVLECGLACSCDPKSCTNRVVQQGIKKSLHIFQTKHKGYGLMLDKNSSEVPSLSFICEYAGEVIGDAEARKRMKETDITKQLNYLISLREHVLETETCIYIDPRYIGNVGRFINHSCDPNLFMVPIRVNHPVPRLALFARKNIKSGEELTFDYSGNTTFNLSSGSINKDKPFNSQTFSSHSETSDSSGDVSLGNMDKIGYTSYSNGNISSGNMDNIVHTSDSTGNISSGGLISSMMNKIPESSAEFEEPDTNYPRKRMKTCQTDYMDHNDEQTDNSLFNSKHTTQSHWNSDDQDKRENKVTLQQSAHEVVNQDTPLCETTNIKAANFTPSIFKRKHCLCGSLNCTGFLPFDSGLLCN